MTSRAYGDPRRDATPSRLSMLSRREQARAKPNSLDIEPPAAFGALSLTTALTGWAAALSLVAVGANYLSSPQRTSRSTFGLPAITRAERAFLAAKAIRDLGLGLIAVTLLLRRDRAGAGAVFAIGAAGPALDGALLTLIRGLRPQLGLHWGAVALMGIAARALLTSGKHRTASVRWAH